MQYENLILDDELVVQLTPEDKKFLERFSNLVLLSLNSTKLKSVDNLPEAKLVKVSALYK